MSAGLGTGSTLHLARPRAGSLQQRALRWTEAAPAPHPPAHPQHHGLGSACHTRNPEPQVTCTLQGAWQPPTVSTVSAPEPAM